MLLRQKISTMTFHSDMQWDLIRPCKICPFANTKERITFSCRDRAREIEHAAYRRGFVCHEHAEYIEGNDYCDGGFDFRADGTSQHCFGAVAMYLKNGGNGNVPFEWACYDDEELYDRWWKRVDMKGLETVFESEEEFIEANDG